MGNKEKTTNQTIKQTMKFASIIAIAAVLSFSAEAQRNGDRDRDGDRDGGRGGGRGRIPRRFRNSDGALVGCRVRENPDGPIGGGFMYQNEGEDTYVRTFWKDLDFWDGFDDEDFDPRTVDIDVYANTVDNCMDATAVHTAIGSFKACDSGKGRFFDPEKAGVMLTGADSVVGQYLGIAVDGEIIQCCELRDLRAEQDNDDSSDD